MADVKAAGDMVARFTDMGTQARRNDGAANANRNTAPAAPANPAVSGARQAGDVVAFTDTANTVQQAEKALAKEPVVDAARVERLRASVADGSYQVDPQRVADKMIDMESSLSGERT